MEDETDFAAILGPALASAIEKKGFVDLTSVQKTVLDPALAGRDLRITSQTGSGKTLAIGFALRDLVVPSEAGRKPGPATPNAIVVAPTRELAHQVEEELSWLYEPMGVRVASVTGGASYRDERRELARGPAVVVGTPGRLIDHLDRGSIDASGLGAIVLDEADRMLDMGFRDELEAILAKTPEGRRTHLVSATFPRDVRVLADRVQTDAAHVEGTRLGAANVDIDHVLHVVDPHDRVGAIINLLLANPGEQTLVFARTRADVAGIARELAQAGFATSSLSGEMEQDQRNRALAGFRSGALRVLVATDVAARGIDVVDIARVIQAEPPTDADTYTHRSGRTGRAGRKGTSSLLVSPASVSRAQRLVERTGSKPRFEPIPSADAIRRVNDDRLFAELTADDGDAAAPQDERTRAMAERLAAVDESTRTRTLTRLLAKLHRTGNAEPRDVRVVHASASARRPPLRERSAERAASPRSDGPRFERGDGPRSDGPRAPLADKRSGDYRPFHVTWGEVHGADARRLLAVVCRRGDIRGSDVGAIRVGATWSIVEVAASVAQAFAEACQKPDPRNPRIAIRPDAGSVPPPAGRAPRATHPHDGPPAPRAPRPHDDAPRPDEERPHARAIAPRPDEERPHARAVAPRPDEERPHARATRGRDDAPRAPRPRDDAPRPDERPHARAARGRDDAPRARVPAEAPPRRPARPRDDAPAPSKAPPWTTHEAKKRRAPAAAAGGEIPPKRRPRIFER